MNTITQALEMEFTIENGSYPPDPPDDNTMTLLLQIFALIISLSGLVANIIVFWLLGFRTRRNSFSVYIFTLAGIDCLVLFLEITFLIIGYATFGHPSLYFFTVLWVFAYTTDLSILSCISIERCLCVLFPIWYRCRRPRHMSTVTCALLCILSLLLSIMHGYTCGLLYYYLDGHCKAVNFVFVAWMIFLFVVLSGSSLALLLKMFCGFHRNKLTRFCMTIVLTVLSFLLCGLPMGIQYFLITWIAYDFEILPRPWLVLLSCVNSSINPIIYFFVGSFRQRQRSLKMVLLKALQDTPEVIGAGGSSPQEAMELSGRSVV